MFCTVSTTDAGGGWKFSVSRSAWTFSWSCNTWIWGRIVETVVWRATAVPIRGYFPLCSRSCWRGRWCRMMHEEVSSRCSKRHSLPVVDFEERGGLVFLGCALASRVRCCILKMRLHCPVHALIFRVNCLMWLWMCSSPNFSPIWGPRRLAETFNGVSLSRRVLNFAMALFRTVTIGFPGSLIVDDVGLTFKLFEPGARTSYRPSKFFFERRLPCIFLANFSWTARSLSRIGRHAPYRRKRDSPSVLSLSLSWASRVARVILDSTSMSLLKPFVHFSSGIISSGVTVSSSKYWSTIYS